MCGTKLDLSAAYAQLNDNCKFECDIVVVGSRKKVKLSHFVIEHHTMMLYGEFRLAVYVPYVSDT